MMLRCVFYLALALLLSACSSLKESSDPGRYQHKQDFSPNASLSVDKIPDAVPKIEPITQAGNKSPYKVLGKVYYVLPTAKGYKARGKASWYGMKFQGHSTSNGEVYDVYGMTAAHKTLPLPSYVRVTNLANQRSVIVRVNDRGPFHEDRIIDLSYAAATKLGYVNQGVADVLVEAIDVAQWQAQHSTQPKVLLQVAAYKSQTSAQAAQQKLSQSLTWPVQVEPGKDGYFRVKIGPVGQQDIVQISEKLQSQGFSKPMVIQVE